MCSVHQLYGTCPLLGNAKMTSIYLQNPYLLDSLNCVINDQALGYGYFIGGLFNYKAGSTYYNYNYKFCKYIIYLKLDIAE